MSTKQTPLNKLIEYMEKERIRVFKNGNGEAEAAFYYSIQKATELLAEEEQMAENMFEVGKKRGESYIPYHGYDDEFDFNQYFSTTFKSSKE